jgi:HAE1 family hydrophobic/amphiphilic exporter-1
LSTINTGNAQGKMYASIYIRMVDRKARKRGIEEISTLLRERLRHVPGITVTHIGLFDSVGGSKQITFSVIGSDIQTLERIAQSALPKLRAIPGLVDLDSSMKPNKPTLQLQVNREAASDLGLSVAQIGNSLRTLVAGQTVGNWRASDDQTYDVNVRLNPAARDSVTDLERMPLVVGSNADGSGRIVRLNQIANLCSLLEDVPGDPTALPAEQPMPMPTPRPIMEVIRNPKIAKNSKNYLYLLQRELKRKW